MVVDVNIVKRHIKPKADSTLRNMRKDDLIEYIRCLENNYNVAVSFNNQQAKNVESLIPKWIPVAERLPENDDTVIVYRPTMAIAVLSDRYLPHEERWARYGKGMKGDDLITHWMPFPEPPKEVE